MGRKIIRTAALILGEILTAAALLLLFVLLHRGMAAAAPAPTPRPAASAAPAETAAPEIPEAAEALPRPEETPAPEAALTPWQEKFSEHFSPEPLWTENSYTSPEISVTIEERHYGEGSDETVYYVADIYVARIENFRSCLAGDRFEAYSKAPILDMAEAHGAIAAINGDFYSYQYGGIMVRNGEIYRQEQSVYDLCVLYRDGSMETFRPGEYHIEEILERGVWQIWQFGPELLDEEGQPDCSYNTGQAVQFINPRTAVGYYEPGHYCFLVADGRQDGYSAGLFLDELAEIMSDMGCRAAYNLDGGGSSVMSFAGKTVNRQSNGGDREISDLLLIAELSKEG